jgi:hypothetical protein
VQSDKIGTSIISLLFPVKAGDIAPVLEQALLE